MKILSLSWKRYLFDLLSVFLGVTLAFALNNWNEDRRDRKKETKILTEIQNGLKLDSADMQLNIEGHKRGIKACNYFRRLALGEQVNQDSFPVYYSRLLRDFITIQNSSAYEALKSSGLEKIRNDSLRLKIIAVYDFYFELVKKLEEEYSENQFNENYFHSINDILAPYITFDEKGEVRAVQQPLRLPKTEKNKLLLYVARIKFNRKFTIDQYNVLKEKILDLKEDIAMSLTE